MVRLNAAAAALTAGAFLCLTACGGHGGSSGMSLLPQMPNELLYTQPGPAPAQTFAPSAFMANTSVGIHALQVFDEAHGFVITPAQGIAHGVHYASIWGVHSPHMASSWHTNNESLNTLI